MAIRTPGPPPPLDDQLCYAIYSAGIAIQRIYKPLLDELGLTYPQYLVMNVLWREDGQTVGAIAEHLALEPSTLTPLLKRLEASGFVTRTRNPENERQVVIALAEAGLQLRERAGCLGQALLQASGRTPAELAGMKADIRGLRDAIYGEIGGWKPQS
jgi:DNA-binding MarR family transcriptional regulator